MDKKIKTGIAVGIVLVITIVVSIFVFVENKNISNTANDSEKLVEEYSQLAVKYHLKYKTYSEAVAAFKESANNNEISPESIAFYVPGKVPREDGDPYFIGRGVISKIENKCIKGYFNLVSGEGKVWQDVCVIYN